VLDEVKAQGKRRRPSIVNEDPDWDFDSDELFRAEVADPIIDSSDSSDSESEEERKAPPAKKARGSTSSPRATKSNLAAFAARERCDGLSRREVYRRFQLRQGHDLFGDWVAEVTVHRRRGGIGHYPLFIDSAGNVRRSLVEVQAGKLFDEKRGFVCPQKIKK
jgi:hypothetical protein